MRYWINSINWSSVLVLEVAVDVPLLMTIQAHNLTHLIGIPDNQSLRIVVPSG